MKKIVKKISRFFCFVALLIFLLTACAGNGEIENYIATEYPLPTTASPATEPIPEPPPSLQKHFMRHLQQGKCNSFFLIFQMGTLCR